MLRKWFKRTWLGKKIEKRARTREMRDVANQFSFATAEQRKRYIDSRVSGKEHKIAMSSAIRNMQEAKGTGFLKNNAERFGVSPAMVNEIAENQGAGKRQLIRDNDIIDMIQIFDKANLNTERFENSLRIYMSNRLNGTSHRELLESAVEKCRGAADRRTNRAA